MHIQIRTSLKTAAFSADANSPVEGSIAYARGTLGDLLEVLAERRSDADPGFSLAAASGHDIELGGEFTFWVHPREGVDDNHEVATLRALERIQEAAYDANRYDVERRHLNDEVGTLKDFVDEVTGKGLHIVEISIGTPEEKGIPVQIYTAQTR